MWIFYLRRLTSLVLLVTMSKHSSRLTYISLSFYLGVSSLLDLFLQRNALRRFELNWYFISQLNGCRCDRWLECHRLVFSTYYVKMFLCGKFQFVRLLRRAWLHLYSEPIAVQLLLVVLRCKTCSGCLISTLHLLPSEVGGSLQSLLLISLLRLLRQNSGRVATRYDRCGLA